jgi:predicted AAA+ superfamily ATPase
MIGRTYRGYVVGVITKNTILTVQRGVGAKKVLLWGKRPAGQSFVCTREIR